MNRRKGKSPVQGQGPADPLEQPLLFQEVKRIPRIIPRPQHCVSRKDMDREALKVLYRLKDHGFIAYLVGGSVRDLLIGKTPKDFDIGTNATPSQVRKLFRYSRIIGRRFRIVHVYFRGGKVIEVSTFRRQTDYDDYEAFKEGIDRNEIYGSPQQDALRRDLTINGLFYNIADFSIIDYVGGMEDLRAGLIRTIGDPDRRFVRDPVRMMRAVRHAARTGFKIEEKTWAAMGRHRKKLSLCAVPRVRDEWLKDVRVGYSQAWYRLIYKSGLFDAIFPNYFQGLDLDQRSRVDTLLFDMLGLLDKLVTAGGEVEEAFVLSVLIYPRLSQEPQWHRLDIPKVRWRTQEVRELVAGLLDPYDFKRAVRDETAQLLASLWPLGLCSARGSWPKRVVNKVNFPHALELYNLVAKATGRPCAVYAPEGESPKAPGRGKKGRGHRRYRNKKKQG